jgi:hypothetical protein
VCAVVSGYGEVVHQQFSATSKRSTKKVQHIHIVSFRRPPSPFLFFFFFVKKEKRERTNPPHVYTRHLGHKRERHTHHLRVYIGKRIRKEITQFNQSVTGFFFLFSGVYPAHLINVVTMNTAERHIAYIGCYDYATTTGNRKKKSTTNDLTSMPARVKVDQHSEITKNPPTILII